LEQKMASFDYPGVWEFINKEVFENDFGEPVIVPENEEDLLKINRELKSDTKSLKKLYKKYGDLTAVLPVFGLFLKKETIQQDELIKELLDLSDTELFEKNILMPKPGCLEKLYDKKIGLDKWLKN
jgi:hypothetical protein